MNVRERFLEIMNFNTKVPTLKWEFGYWGGTINKWYKSGLPKNNYVTIPRNLEFLSSGIYTTSWISKNKYISGDEYPNGYVLSGGGLYNPNQGFGKDNDVRDYFRMDEQQQLVDVNYLFYPLFETEILEEDDNKLKYRDIDGVIRVYLKEQATMASGWEWPIKDWDSWNKIKEERLDIKKDIRSRLGKNWSEKVREYKNRNYVLALGGYPIGFFGTLAHLIGYEELFYMYHDDPELVHDILNTLTDVWIAVFSEVLKDVEVDLVQIWEDVSFDSGSMLPMSIMREFMLPYYKRLTSFLKGAGVKYIFVDTDGMCMDIIPFFIEGGANGMFPFEVNCGMDVLKVRKEFPELRMMGGIPKSEIQKGPTRIDEILAPVEEMLKFGGYIPFGDHFIPPEVDWEGFKYYRTKLNNIINAAAK